LFKIIAKNPQEFRCWTCQSCQNSRRSNWRFLCIKWPINPKKCRRNDYPIKELSKNRSIFLSFRLRLSWHKRDSTDKECRRPIELHKRRRRPCWSYNKINCWIRSLSSSEWRINCRYYVALFREV